MKLLGSRMSELKSKYHVILGDMDIFHKGNTTLHSTESKCLFPYNLTKKCVVRFWIFANMIGEKMLSCAFTFASEIEYVEEACMYFFFCENSVHIHLTSLIFYYVLNFLLDF